MFWSIAKIIKSQKNLPKDIPCINRILGLTLYQRWSNNLSLDVHSLRIYRRFQTTYFRSSRHVSSSSSPSLFSFSLGKYRALASEHPWLSGAAPNFLRPDLRWEDSSNCLVSHCTVSWELGDQKSSLSQLSPALLSFVGEDSSHCASWATWWILLTRRMIMITVVIVMTLFQTDSTQCDSWARDLPCDGDPNYTDDHTWTSMWIMYISKYFIVYISPFRQQRNFVQLCTSKIITMISLLLLLLLLLMLMILFRLRMIMWWTLKKHAATRF